MRHSTALPERPASTDGCFSRTRVRSFVPLSRNVRRLALATCLGLVAMLGEATLALGQQNSAIAPAEASDLSSERDAQQQAIVVTIDRVLADSWRKAGVEPAPIADDAEFVRRVYLDLTGVIPRVSEVREFLADTRPDKRDLLIDSLGIENQLAERVDDRFDARISGSSSSATSCCRTSTRSRMSRCRPSTPA